MALRRLVIGRGREMREKGEEVGDGKERAKGDTTSTGNGDSCLEE